MNVKTALAHRRFETMKQRRYDKEAENKRKQQLEDKGIALEARAKRAEEWLADYIRASEVNGLRWARNGDKIVQSLSLLVSHLRRPWWLRIFY